MGKEIVQVNADKISEMTGYSSGEIAVVKANVAKGTTDSELAYFLNVCKSVGLNPFNKETWCYKDHKGNLLVFTGRDGFLSKAQSNPAFNGIRSCEVCENDTFKMDVANNKITHEFGTKDRGKIVGAYAIAFRKNGEPTIEHVKIEDYDKNQFTWKSHKADMIKKVAETKALKKGFGISGVQSEYDFEVKGDVVVPVVEVNNPESEEEFKIYLKEFDSFDELNDKKVSLRESWKLKGVHNSQTLIQERLTELKNDNS